MTKFRSPSALLAVSIGVALLAAVAPAAAEQPYLRYKLQPAFIKSWSTSGDADLPAPPKLADAPPQQQGRDFLTWQRGGPPPQATGPGHIVIFPSPSGKTKQLKAK